MSRPWPELRLPEPATVSLGELRRHQEALVKRDDGQHLIEIARKHNLLPKMRSAGGTRVTAPAWVLQAIAQVAKEEGAPPLPGGVAWSVELRVDSNGERWLELRDTEKVLRAKMDDGVRRTHPFIGTN
jgi:hypothetical protein